MCQSNTLQAGRFGGPLLCNLVASLHLSRSRKRGKGKSGQGGWRIRTPTWWGCREAGREGGRDRGAGLRLLPPHPPAVPPPSGCEPGRRQAAGGCGAGRVSPGAQQRESRGARGPAARPGLAASPPGTAAAAAAPAAPQQSVRLLLQLPRVEGLRGGKARRREGRGGMKAAWSLPRGGGGRGVMRGCTEPPPPRSATRPHRGRQPTGQWEEGELESLESSWDRN